MIQLGNVSFAYSSEVQALDNVSMRLENGRIYAIIGHTGSGKSTLIRHLNGLLKPQSGRVLVDGTDINEKNADIKSVRRRVGLVFQYPEHQLFAETVFEDIAFGPKNLGLDEDTVRLRVDEAMRAVGLTEDMKEKSPFNLSGGEKRRAALAGVLAMQPQTLVLDEPSAGLDPGSRRAMQDIITRIHKEQPENTIVFVSHSMDETALMAEHIFVIDSGRIILSGSRKKVFSESEILYNSGLGLPSVTELTAELRRRGINIGAAYTVSEAAKMILYGLH